MSVSTTAINGAILLLLMIQVIVSAIAYRVLSNNLFDGDSEQKMCILYQVKGDPSTYYNESCKGATNLFTISLIMAPLLIIFYGVSAYKGFIRQRALSYSLAVLHLILAVLTLAGACLLVIGLQKTSDSRGFPSVDSFIADYSARYMNGNQTLIPTAINAAWASVISWVITAAIEFVHGYAVTTAGKTATCH